MLDPRELDPILMNPKRFSIATILYVLGPKRMSDIVKYLKTSWGDVGTHVKKLEEAGYVERVKVLTRFGERVYIRLTDKGAEAYIKLVKKFEKLASSIPSRPKIKAIEGIELPK